MSSVKGLTRIQPIIMPKGITYPKVDPIFFPTWAKQPTPDMLPRVEMVLMHQLYINHEYQRKLAEKSYKLIRSMAVDWDWSSFHLPVVAPVDIKDGLTGEQAAYEVLDGQHTCIGARTNGSIHRIPVMIVKAFTIREKAESFVALNTNRVEVTNVQKFWAGVTAGIELNCQVVEAAKRAGAQIIKRPPPYGEFSPGEVSAMRPLLDIVKRYGESGLHSVLSVCVQLRLAPIGQNWIRAIEKLLLDKNIPCYVGDQLGVGHRIVLTVRQFGIDELEQQAYIERRTSKHSVYVQLANIIREKLVG